MSLRYVDVLPNPPRGSEAWSYSAIVGDLPTIGVDLAFAGDRDPRHVVLTFPGGDGRSWWSDELPSDYAAADIPPGWAAVDVRWHSTWFDGPKGAGPAGISARLAEVIRYVQFIYAGAEVSVVGSSAGATGVISAVAFHGVRVRQLVLCSGPLVGITRMCLGDRGPRPGTVFVDKSFGADTWFGFSGPCRRRDKSWTPAWDAADVAFSPDADLGDVPITCIFGEEDHVSPRAPRRVRQYLPTALRVMVPGVGHTVHETEAGLEAIVAALTA